MTEVCMKGKHVAVTGATAGIGRAASMELARRGARLTLFCRSAEKAAILEREIRNDGGDVSIIIMDMADLASVREAAKIFLQREEALDVLVNNAGIVNTSRKESAQGYEETLAVNHFAPFLLTGLLLPALRSGQKSRIVNVSSGAHAFVKDMGYEDMQAKRKYSTFHEYGRSKLANILFTRQLAHILARDDITVNCLHPGAVSTSLGTQNNGLMGKVLPLLLKPFFRTPEKGAETSLYLCSSEEVAEISGEYFVNCKAVKPRRWARDDAAAQRLWDYTEQILDFRYPL
ncbi:MAG: SDR family oxidoreductase [Halioglobus sp.]|nr:SDR family oxidoreductase [Halioglobus sp.]